jgi:hypothetical protein
MANPSAPPWPAPHKDLISGGDPVRVVPMALVAVVTAGAGVSQSIVRSGRPAKPSIETDIGRIRLRRS